VTRTFEKFGQNSQILRSRVSISFSSFKSRVLVSKYLIVSVLKFQPSLGLEDYVMEYMVVLY